MLPRVLTIAVLLAAAAPLGGCGDNVVNSRVFYVGPNFNRDEDKSCEELAKLIKAKDEQIRKIEGLIAKAEQDAGGSVVATMVHKPALAPLQAERYAYREAAQQKRCPL
jgi:hypothetical protein